MVFFQRLLFLGTSAAVPQPGKRNVSSILLQFTNGRFLLVDCGEGTQHQLMLSNARMNRITSILITHLHGDHCFGVFGLLHTLNMGGRVDDLYIYGPRGIREMIDTVMRLSGGWHGYPVHILELDTESVTQLEIPIGDSEKLQVTACPMSHRIDTVGFVFRESRRPAKLDAEKARLMGVSGHQLGDLKSGKDVRLHNGTVIMSSDCLIESEHEARICAVLQDTSDGSAAIPYLENCDLLVHECTYDNSQCSKAHEFGHATPDIAASLAVRCKARRLALTHFSPRFETTESLGEEAKLALAGHECEVILATDFLEIKFYHFLVFLSSLMASRAKIPLDPLKICTAVRARFPGDAELHSLADAVLEALVVRAGFETSDKARFDKLGTEVQRDTMKVVNLVKEKLSLQAFKDFVASVQNAPAVSESQGHAAPRRQATRKLTAPEPGTAGAMVTVLRTALGPDSQRLRLTENAVGFLSSAVDYWLSSSVVRLNELSVRRAPEFSASDCGAEAFMLSKELAAAHVISKLAGVEPQPIRQDEIRMAASEEAETHARTTRLLRRISSRDISAFLKLGDFPENFNRKYSAQAAFSSASVDLRTRTASQTVT